MTVDEASAPHAERDGEAFFFCSDHCRQKFLSYQEIEKVKSWRMMNKIRVGSLARAIILATGAVSTQVAMAQMNGGGGYGGMGGTNQNQYGVLGIVGLVVGVAFLILLGVLIARRSRT